MSISLWRVRHLCALLRFPLFLKDCALRSLPLPLWYLRSFACVIAVSPLVSLLESNQLIPGWCVFRFFLSFTWSHCDSVELLIAADVIRTWWTYPTRKEKRKRKKILHWDCSTFKRLYGTERQITGQIWWLCEFMGNRGCHAAIEDEHNENTSELETKWIHLISASVCRLKNSATRSSCAVTMLPNGFFSLSFSQYLMYAHIPYDVFGLRGGNRGL